MIVSTIDQYWSYCIHFDMKACFCLELYANFLFKTTRRAIKAVSLTMSNQMAY